MKSEDLAAYPLLSEAWNYLLLRFPFARSSLERLNQEEYCQLAALPLRSFKQAFPKTTIHQAVDAHIRYSMEFLQLQSRLERELNYPRQQFSAVKDRVYDNSETMNGYYLNGLFLSQLFWPNHFLILQFYRQWLEKRTGNFAEIPVGTGVFSLLATWTEQFIPITAVDISSHALRYSQKLLAGKPGILFFKGDILKGLPWRDASVDTLVCGELIEHLEDPRRALKELKRVLKPGGEVFLTTAIFAAAVDHLYLFRSAAEVRKMLQETGFTIVEELVLPVFGNQNERELSNRAVNYAAILRHAAS